MGLVSAAPHWEAVKNEQRFVAVLSLGTLLGDSGRFTKCCVTVKGHGLFSHRQKARGVKWACGKGET